MSFISRKKFNRRTILKESLGLGAVAASGMVAAPALAANRSIKVGAYGGYFEDSFKEHVYPAFTKATGIEVKSVTQPDSTSWLQTMMQAQNAGNVPADLSMHTPVNFMKGSRLGEIFAKLDPSKISNLSYMDRYFVHEGNVGVEAIGAMSVFASMVINTNEVKNVPTSWADFWDSEKFEASLGLPKAVTFKFLDVVAATFFDGAETLRSNDGIVAVVEKAAELHRNVALWYSAESQMEQSLKNFDVIGGMYFHDVAGLMAAEGHPIASIFPKEGNPIDYNSWTLAASSGKSDEAHEFINFCLEPSTQALMSRKIGTAPVVDVSLTDLSKDEIASVAGTPAIKPAYDVYLDNETFVKETWDKMVAKS